MQWKSGLIDVIAYIDILLLFSWLAGSVGVINIAVCLLKYGVSALLLHRQNCEVVFDDLPHLIQTYNK